MLTLPRNGNSAAVTMSERAKNSEGDEKVKREGKENARTRILLGDLGCVATVDDDGVLNHVAEFFVRSE